MLAIITLIINYYSLFCMSQDWKLDAGAYYSGCYRHPHWWVSLAISTMATGVDSHQHLQPSGWQNSLFLVLGGCLFTVGPGTGLSLYHEMLLIKTRQIIPESPCSVGTENSDTYLKEEMSWFRQGSIKYTRVNLKLISRDESVCTSLLPSSAWGTPWSFLTHWVSKKKVNPFILI